MNFWPFLREFFTRLSGAVPPKTSPMSDGLYLPFEEKIQRLIAQARAEGLEVGMFEGFRSHKRQAELYAKGRGKPGPRVTNAKAGMSMHNYGIAADIVFRENGKWSWAEKHPWSRLGAIGKSVGLEWGGDWTSIKDRPHFELPTNLTLTKMNSLYQKGGLAEVWEHL